MTIIRNQTADEQYNEAAHYILTEGARKMDRTGTGTIGIFGHQMRFNLQDAFPLLTSKKVFTKGIFKELVWLLMGDSNISYLQEHGVKIWDSWALPNGETGPMYPTMWRHFPNGIPVQKILDAADVTDGPTFQDVVLAWANDPMHRPIDQLQDLLGHLRKKPFSRRLLISAWHPAVLPDESVSPLENVKNGKQSLAACHTFFQFGVEPLTQEQTETALNRELEKLAVAAMALGVQLDKHVEKNAPESVAELERFTKLRDAMDDRRTHYLEELRKLANGEESNHSKRIHLQLYQRSCDLPLGGPFNVASYATLLMIVAQKLGFTVGDFIWTVGDMHVYSNQIDLLAEQIKREARPLPQLFISGVGGSDNWEGLENLDFFLVGYDPHPEVKYPAAAV